MGKADDQFYSRQRSLKTMSALNSSRIPYRYGRCKQFVKSRVMLEQLHTDNLTSKRAFKCMEEDIRTLHVLYRQGCRVSEEVCYSILLRCIQFKILKYARQMMLIISGSAMHLGGVLTDQLIRIFACSGALFEACLVFCNALNLTVYNFQAIIAAHVSNGEHKAALCLLKRMQEEKVQPNHFVFSCILKSCCNIGALGKGQMIYSEIVKRGISIDMVTWNALMHLYCKCERLEEATTIFQGLACRTVVSWCVLIDGYVQYGKHSMAFELFQHMLNEGIKPSKVTDLAILKACDGLNGLCKGQLIHHQIVNDSFESDVYIGNTLINMYGKCGRIEDARAVFGFLHNHSAVSLSLMVAGYILNEDMQAASVLLEHWQLQNSEDDKNAIMNLLKSCASISDVGYAKSIHKQICKSGLESDTAIESMLIDLYAKCGSLEDAQRVFDNIRDQNVITWNAIINVHVEHGDATLALEKFRRMRQETVKPDKVIYLSCLKACSAIGALEAGMLLHKEVIIDSLDSDARIKTNLTDMYGKCGCLDDSLISFHSLKIKDPLSWNVIISAHVQQQQYIFALELFRKMYHEGNMPDKILVSCILNAFSEDETLLWHGKAMHCQTVITDLEKDTIVGNALIDMYAKCGSLEEANMVFNRLSYPNVVSWGLIIAGCVDHEQNQAALSFFSKMQDGNIEPNTCVLLSILKACTVMEAQNSGRILHDMIIRTGFESNMSIGNSLLNMYAKCGLLKDACNVFTRLPDEDVVSWCSIIIAYAQHGQHEMAKKSMNLMQQHGIQPNGTVYLGLLGSCGQAGMLDGAQMYLMKMKQFHGIILSPEHLNCMTDLLGRLGCLYEAYHLIQSMLFHSDVTCWMSLLSACKTYSDVKLGEYCFDQILHFNPDFGAAHVIMSSIYADAQMWNEFNTLQRRRKVAALKNNLADCCVDTRKRNSNIMENKSHTVVPGSCQEMDDLNFFF